MCVIFMRSLPHSPIPRHSIQSGVWNTAQLAYNGDTQYTIMDAIDVWYQNGSTGMSFRDTCRTPHCNLECPERVIFSPLQPKEWPMIVRISLASVVVGIAVSCILLKVSTFVGLITPRFVIFRIFFYTHDTSPPSQISLGMFLSVAEVA